MCLPWAQHEVRKSSSSSGSTMLSPRGVGGDGYQGTVPEHRSHLAPWPCCSAVCKAQTELCRSSAPVGFIRGTATGASPGHQWQPKPQHSPGARCNHSRQALLPYLSWEPGEAGLEGHISMAWTGAPAGRAAPSRLAGGGEPGAGSGQRTGPGWAQCRVRLLGVPARRRSPLMAFTEAPA